MESGCSGNRNDFNQYWPVTRAIPSMSNRIHIPGLRFRSLIPAALLVCMLSLPAMVSGQWMEPNRLKIGASLGFGGVHAWGKPSFDLHYAQSTLRLAPGLNFFSIGFTQKIGFYAPKRRKDRTILLSAYYHNDWLLAPKKSPDHKKDQQIYMLMPGIHVNLNHRGTIFFQVSGGVMYMHEVIKDREDTSIKSTRDFFSPMGEVRLGTIFLRRKYYVQQFPRGKKKHKNKKVPADRVKKKKLKFTR